jgi:hypothetical protein
VLRLPSSTACARLASAAVLAHESAVQLLSSESVTYFLHVWGLCGQNHQPVRVRSHGMVTVFIEITREIFV